MSADAAAAPPKKSSKMMLVLLGLVLVPALGGGGAWWFLGRPVNKDVDEVQHAPAAKPIFSVLEPFTVNLRDERGERFAQIGVTLEITDPAVDQQIKDRLPTVRNDILLLITSKRIEELLTPEGKDQLAEQVRTKAGEALGWENPEAEPEDEATGKNPNAKRKKKHAPPNPVQRVLFSQFIVQ